MASAPVNRAEPSNTAANPWRSLPVADLGREPLAHQRAEGATQHQWQEQGEAGRGPVAEGREGHQGVDGDQQQAGATGQRHRQARQEHQGRHDREAAAHAGDAGEQAHHQALGRQRQRRNGAGRCEPIPGEQPGGEEGRRHEHQQLHRLADVAGLHPAAADPAAGQGRDTELKSRPWRELTAAQIGAEIAQRQQHHHQQREGHRLLGGQGSAADQ